MALRIETSGYEGMLVATPLIIRGKFIMRNSHLVGDVNRIIVPFVFYDRTPYILTVPSKDDRDYIAAYKYMIIFENGYSDNARRVIYSSVYIKSDFINNIKFDLIWGRWWLFNSSNIQQFIIPGLTALATFATAVLLFIQLMKHY